MKPSDLSIPDPKKILMIKLGAVGDLVIASSFFDGVRRHFPRAGTILLTGKSSHRTIENNPCIDRLILADDKVIYHGAFFARIREVVRLLRLLRKERFDLVFVLHRAWPFNLLAFLCGVPCRVGFSRGREGIMLTHRVIPQPSRNEREIHLDLLRALGIAIDYEKSFYYISEEESRFASRFLARHNIKDDESLIAIAPGGGKNVKSYMPSRRWPVENFSHLIRKILEETSSRVFLVGGLDDREIAARLRTDHPECLDATDLSFGQMAALFSHCHLFIGNNSSSMHIASAMGTPTLSFHGPINPLEWAPPGPENAILYKQVECSPCYDQGRFPECHHLECLHSITVEETWEKVLPRLRRVSKRS